MHGKFVYPEWIIQIEYNNNYIYILFNSKLYQHANIYGFTGQYLKNYFYIYIEDIEHFAIYHEFTHVINKINNTQDANHFQKYARYIFTQTLKNDHELSYQIWLLSLEELSADTNALYGVLNNTYKQLHNEYSKTLYFLFLHTFFYKRNSYIIDENGKYIDYYLIVSNLFISSQKNYFEKICDMGNHFGYKYPKFSETYDKKNYLENLFSMFFLCI